MTSRFERLAKLKHHRTRIAASEIDSVYHRPVQAALRQAGFDYANGSPLHRRITESRSIPI